MHRPFPIAQVRSGLRHLRAADPVLGGVIERVGPFRMTLDPDGFRALVRSILAQQISGGAARSIGRRLEALVAPRRVTAGALRALTPDQLRSAGVSPQKIRYLLDLAGKVDDGTLRLARLRRMEDRAVIDQLTQVTGIGVWTAQMYLMFSLGRPDVLPHDDFGIRSALRRLYGLRDLPDRATTERIAAPWRPHATIASWYCWRSLELPGPESG